MPMKSGSLPTNSIFLKTKLVRASRERIGYWSLMIHDSRLVGILSSVSTSLRRGVEPHGKRTRHRVQKLRSRYISSIAEGKAPPQHGQPSCPSFEATAPRTNFWPRLRGMGCGGLISSPVISKTYTFVPLKVLLAIYLDDLEFYWAG